MAVNLLLAIVGAFFIVKNSEASQCEQYRHALACSASSTGARLGDAPKGSKLSNIWVAFFLVFCLLAVLFSNGLTLNLLGRIFVLDDSLLVFGRTFKSQRSAWDHCILFIFLFCWNLLSGLSRSVMVYRPSLIITALWVPYRLSTPSVFSGLDRIDRPDQRAPALTTGHTSQEWRDPL